VDLTCQESKLIARLEVCDPRPVQDFGTNTKTVPTEIGCGFFMGANYENQTRRHHGSDNTVVKETKASQTFRTSLSSRPSSAVRNIIVNWDMTDIASITESTAIRV
jgi:hypothetical protein